MYENSRPTKSNLKQVDALSENDIDYSDIPELTDNFWKNAKIVNAPKKQSLTVRYDSEIIDYLKEHVGKGYQSKMNAILKAYVEYEKRHNM